MSVLAILLFMTWTEIVPDVTDLIHLAPVVRITPGMLVVLPLALFALVSITLIVMRSIPVDDEVAARVDEIGTRTLYLTALMLALIGVSPLIQHAVMPALGYTKCNILDGHPNLYFSDWVRNSELCVKGKTRDWVREQTTPQEGARSR
ncbi:MAG: hypothetical protein FWD68_18400 [Alphaproteobacteria bacterium]|nr:hypothetical protein [Alphaproteobacteria bacterium]